MPTQIEIQPDIAAKLFALAEMRGVSIDTLLRDILNQLGKPDEPLKGWQLAGSIELLDDDLENGSQQITNNLKNSLLETARNL